MKVIYKNQSLKMCAKCIKKRNETKNRCFLNARKHAFLLTVLSITLLTVHTLPAMGKEAEKKSFFVGSYNPNRYLNLDKHFNTNSQKASKKTIEDPTPKPLKKGQTRFKDPWLKDKEKKEPLGTTKLKGTLATEARLFLGDPALPQQNKGNTPSLSFEGSYEYISPNKKHTYVLTPFFRTDFNDKDREHADLREAFWHFEERSWETKVGIDKVFWGVMESNHLVDVINQTDLVEDPDGEEKLGQPMIQFGHYNSLGTVRLFILPVFRERTYPGINGRLRGPLPIQTDMVRYESQNKEETIDAAIRYTHTLGNWDIGVAHFSGTSREPAFTTELASNGRFVSVPTYHLMDQTSIDLQYTAESTLYKLEAFSRETQGERFEAFSTGFEHTLYDLNETGVDLGILAEYHHDARPYFLPIAQLNNDTFIGMRVTANDIKDKQLLLGVMVDNKTKNRIFSMEYSQRINDLYRLEIEGALFAGKADPSARIIREDDYILIRLKRYF